MAREDNNERLYKWIILILLVAIFLPVPVMVRCVHKNKQIKKEQGIHKSEIETLKAENKELLRVVDMKTHRIILLNNEVAKYHRRRPDSFLDIK